MSTIRILPDRVANQIAAGEVVERPASIVKELLENSLDAGATRIDVSFRHGGRSMIRIEDNGCGMSRDDALLSLERHATSKIREAGDLDHIATFGFRGEALPSIASVSRFLLQTRDAASESGTEILVNGGRVVHVRDCGMPVGTRIEVSHLFNSVPARRKFLKSDATEAAHLIHHTRLHALANPQVAFSLTEDHRTVFRSAGCGSLAERVSELFGRRTADELVPLDATEGDLTLSGLVSRPGVVRSSRHEMIVFVNRRPVESRTLAYAILESYQALIPKGRYPVAFVFLQVDPAAVDVNVHPAKREVRFRDEVRVRSFTIRAVLGTLRGLGQPAPASEAMPASWEARLPAKASAAASDVAAPEIRQAIASIERAIAPRSEPAPRSVEPAPRPAAFERKAVQGSVGGAAPEATAVAPTAQARPWTVVGTLAGGYSLFESPGGLVVLDRRAAAGRVWYERLRHIDSSTSGSSQRLLFAVPLELDPVGSDALQEHLPLLKEQGFVIEPFGRNFFRIEEVPVWLDPGEAESFARDLVGLLRSGRIGGGNLRQARDLLAQQGAARAARAATRQLPDAALLKLVDDLLRCEHPHVGPDGRPTFIEVSQGELARRFHRAGGVANVAED